MSRASISTFARLLEEVREEARPTLVPASLVDSLRSHTAASGFRNVYQAGSGWLAKVKEGGRLYTIPGSRQPTPQQAAAFVVAYYRNRYGRRWRWALAARKRVYWRVRRTEAGWVVDVWVRGVRRTWAEVPRGTKPLVHARRELAVRFAQRFMRSRWAEAVWRGE